MAVLVVVDHDMHPRPWREGVVHPGRGAVDEGKVGAVLNGLGLHLLHLDIEEVDHCAVLLVPDDPVIEDPAGKLLGIRVPGDGCKGHCASDRVRVGILVRDDSKSPLPTRKEIVEALREPADMEPVDLVDCGPGNHLLRIEDEVCPR